MTELSPKQILVLCESRLLSLLEGVFFGFVHAVCNELMTIWLCVFQGEKVSYIDVCVCVLFLFSSRT